MGCNGRSLEWFRVSLLLALGLGTAACGPAKSDASSSDGDADGDGESSATTIASSTGATTGMTATSDGSTTTPPGWPDPPWCGVAPPDNATPPPTCVDPQPVLQEGPDGQVPTGFIACADGWRHREAQVECLYPPDLVGSCETNSGTESGSGSGSGGTESGGVPAECVTDADCDAAPHGYCNLEDSFKGKDPSCGCEYGCATDADCNDNQVCMCAGASSRCITAHCVTDADCGAYKCQQYGNVLACQGAFDTCHSYADCMGDCPLCAYSSTNCAWTCEPDGGTCTIGRPFVVHGTARTAEAVARADWGMALELGADDLPAELRDCLARHWIETALAEHASVPAFARFALQLAALGAPAALLADAARAMADEVEHAQLAFALAGHYGGAPVGPGPLAMAGALDDGSDLVEVARLAIVEACVGETLAAIEAAQSAAHADDPWLRERLARVAQDELRHAELGWRFVAWAIERIGSHEPDRAALREAFAGATALAGASVGEMAGGEALRRHGVLDGPTRDRVRADALRQVVQPIAATLLAPAAALASRPTPSRAQCAGRLG